MNHLFLFEEYSGSKFRTDDVERARRENKPVFSSVVKNKPDHDSNEPLSIINIDDTEIGVLIDGDVYYVDLDDIEKIGK